MSERFPTADMRVVVRPNFDTLYSSGWLDLTKEPMVVSVPDTGGRYYLLPMLDMWTDVFASPGWRTTGTRTRQLPRHAARLGDCEKFVEEFRLPDNTQRIDAPTPYVWIIGRTKTDGPADYDAVHKIQAGYKITPLSQWGKEPVAPEVKIDPSIDMKTPPKIAGRHHAGRQVLRLCGRAAQAASAAHHRPADRRAAEAHRLRGRQELRSRQGRSGHSEGARERAGGRAEADGVESADARADRQWLVDEHRHHGRLRQLLSEARHRHSDWVSAPICPRTRSIRSTSPTTPASRSTARSNYTIHFDKGETPPVDAFWSITLYDTDGFQVANSLNRFAVSSWMPFKTNPDGSLDLYFQNESPGADKEANWLPAPKGPFNLTMRLYAPKADALTGKWNPPPVMKAQAVPLSAQ